MGSATPTGHRIQAVSGITGIPRNTLISWERRYRIVTPRRAANGYRYYSRTDILTLQRVARLVRAGHRIGDIARSMQAPRGEPSPMDGLGDLKELLLEALLTYDLERANRLVSRMASATFENSINSVYVPLMIEVGNRWKRGEVSIAQEHFTSTYCRTQLTMMLQQLNSGNHRGERVLAAGFPGERHENGLLATSVLLALRGYAITYLGIDIPIADIGRAAVDANASFVCQSVVICREPEKLASQVKQIREALPESIDLVLGGPGVAEADLAIPGVLVCASIDAFPSHRVPVLDQGESS